MIKKNNGNKDCYRDICGLPINTYFSACKMKYIQQNIINSISDIKDDDVCFGTIDSWIVYVLLSN